MKTRRVYRFLCHPPSNVEGDKVLSIDWRGRAWLVKREMIVLQVSPSLTTPSLRVAGSRPRLGNRQAEGIFRLPGVLDCCLGGRRPLNDVSSGHDATSTSSTT